MWLPVPWWRAIRPGRCRRRIGRRRRSGTVVRLRSAGADQRRVEAHADAPAVQFGGSSGGDRAQAAGGLDESGSGEDLPTEVGRLERRTPYRLLGVPQIAQGEWLLYQSEAAGRL